MTIAKCVEGGRERGSVWGSAKGSIWFHYRRAMLEQVKSTRQHFSGSIAHRSTAGMLNRRQNCANSLVSGGTAEEVNETTIYDFVPLMKTC